MWSLRQASVFTVASQMQAIHSAARKLGLLQEPKEDRQARLRASFAAKIESDALATREEVAAYLCVSPKTVQRIPKPELPRCTVSKGDVRYRPSDVLRFAERSRRPK